MSRIEDGGAVEAGRDIWEVSNQLAGYVDERTPQDLCDFLIRESKAAADLAAEITRLRAEAERLQRIERNRDMWQAQCRMQAEELRRLREYAPDESDPDQLREDRDERQRLAKEYHDVD